MVTGAKFLRGSVTNQNENVRRINTNQPLHVPDRTDLPLVMFINHTITMMSIMINDYNVNYTQRESSDV